MSREVPHKINDLNSMKKYPEHLYYRGDLSLLNRPRVSIVGSRNISEYSRSITYQLAKSLAKRGICVVSGAAMGTDAAAHHGAGYEHTIAVMGNGLDIRYPVINHKMIEKIEEQGLVLSQFEDTFRAKGWSFVVRNELVVALGEILIVSQADLGSGSMRSVEYAKKMGREIWVLPQRLGESSGTNDLLQKGEAKAIYDIESFANRYGKEISDEVPRDSFFYFCQTMPTLDEAVSLYGSKVYEAELEGIIRIENGRIQLE